LSARDARHDAIHGFDKLCRGQQRILSIVHRSCARVICKSFDGDVPPVDANDSFNHSDVYLFTVENSALFDVQFEISSNVALLSSHLGKPRDVSADKLYSFANRFAAAANKVEFFLR
jgi:hypothetical protein